MDNKPKAFWKDSGFLAAMAICLLVVGVGGYFFLFDHGPAKESGAVEYVLPVETAGPAMEVQAETELVRPVAAQEPLSTPEPEPQPVQPVSKPIPMPETVIDPTPVEAVAPRVVVDPLKGDVVAAFAVDSLAYDETMRDWRTHDGVDIAAKLGTNVLAACAGTVSMVAADPLMGTTVVLDHDDGYQTTYANLMAKPPVEVGDYVSAGQVIGAVGATAAAESARASHLHFAVAWEGDAVNPTEFLERS